MTNFSEWLGQQPQQIFAAAVTPIQKKWKATKDQIIAYWQSLRSDIPIQLQPIKYQHNGSTYAEDGIRITGSKEFITAALSRLKELLAYENANTKLSLVWRETDSPSNADGKTSYVFYIQAKERGVKSPRNILTGIK